MAFDGTDEARKIEKEIRDLIHRHPIVGDNAMEWAHCASMIENVASMIRAKAERAIKENTFGRL